MKKITLIIALSIFSIARANALKVKGQVVDETSLEPLVGVSISSSSKLAFSDINGEFVLELIDGEKHIILSYVGYKTDTIQVSNTDIGVITLKTDNYILPDVVVTSQLAIERKTPVASSRVNSFYLEERLGNGELVEILKHTPGVHANRQGGGWGDSEIFMRGFDNTNIAVMINGIPVNDMETGTVYWCDWASLSDATQYIQVQRGIGASNVSAPSVGGTINIVTKGPQTELGGVASYAIGNDGYQKVAFNINSGIMGKGWSFNLFGSYNCGDGYAQGTNFKAFSYYMNLTKQFNDKHQLSIVAFGDPQKHYMRSNALTESEWIKVQDNYRLGNNWREFNPDYGFDSKGNRKSADYNSYHKPIISLGHIWNINEKSSLSTKAYVSFGRGYSLSGKANSDEYSEYDWFGSDYGTLNMKFRVEDGTFDYAKIEEINRNSATGSQMVMSKVIGLQDWYGLISTYSNHMLKDFNWLVGIDLRYYKSLHQNKISDLFGGQYYIDPARANVDINNNPLATDTWKQQRLYVGDVIYRDYDSHIMQEGVFGQIEYNKNRINIFASGSLNYSTYWRYDRLYNTGKLAESRKIGFWGGNIKTGLNFNINRFNNVFVNLGAISKIPQFKSGAFMSANTSNVINKNVVNEKATTAEIGYNFQNESYSIRLNAYYTKWIDKSMTKKGNLVDQYYINMTGVDSKHLGAELEFKCRPFNWMEAGAMISIGDWKWCSDNVIGYAYDIYGQAINDKGIVVEPGSANHAHAKINMKGIHIGGSAQTTASVNVTFKPFTGFRIGGGYLFHDRNYAYYSLSGGSLKLGKELYVLEPWKIPSYGTIDLWSSYKFKVGKFNASVICQVNNLLNNYYIEKAWNPSTVGKQQDCVNQEDVYYFYSLGRTWTTKFKIEF